MYYISFRPKGADNITHDKVHAIRQVQYMEVQPPFGVALALVAALVALCITKYQFLLLLFLSKK